MFLYKYIDNNINIVISGESPRDYVPRDKSLYKVKALYGFLAYNSWTKN